jgi:hypothetical protein
MPIGTPLQKGTLVARLIAAKEASGKTFSQIAAEVGLTNVYCTQLFYNQVGICGRLQQVNLLETGQQQFGLKSGLNSAAKQSAQPALALMLLAARWIWPTRPSAACS